MDASALRAAYTRFLDAAREVRDAPAADGEWRPELVLAHLIVADRQVAAAAARVLGGVPAAFDNRPALSEPYLEAVVAAAGDWDGLVEAARRGGEELAATIERIGPEHSAAEVQAYIVAGDQVMDAPVTLEWLAGVPATRHLPSHTEQLLSYRAVRQ